MNVSGRSSVFFCEPADPDWAGLIRWCRVDVKVFWLWWSSRLCVQQGGFGSARAAIDSSLPQTTHTSGFQLGDGDPHKEQDKPEGL